MSSVLFISICSMFKRIPVHKFSAVIILYLFVLCIFSIPILINPLSSTIHQNNENCLLSATSSFKSLTIHTPNSAKISPAWLYYVYSMLKSNCCAKSVYSSSIDCNSRSICLRQSSVYPLSSTSSSLLSSSSLTDRDTVHQLFTIVSEYTCQHKTLLIVYSFILLCIYIILLVYCLYITEVYKSLKTSISQEIELCRLGVVDYLAFHWGRLNIAQILIYFWSFKIMSVVILGPLYWAVIPAVSYSGNFVNFSARPINSSTLMDYSNPDTGDYSTFSVLITRLYVGVFVHGSETWLSVFGAAAFFSALGTIFVSLLVFLLDPSGDRTAQLAVAAADAPADPNGWNVIEDPALALDQNDVIAFDLLASNGWHCAAVFLFFAFQSDMPNLQPVHRASCCMYGIVVILITCIHPVQALVKSFLLRLGIPGQQTNWSEHIRPLCFWIVLIFAAINIFTNLPKILEAIRARQLRIYLIGCQLLLSLTVTLIEYSVYQYYRRCPDWRGFRPIHPTSEDLQTFGDICPICYTEMTVTTAKITRCGHLYHINCLIEWMKRQFFCPMCHADLLSSKVTDRRNFSDRRNEE
ncbi:unnamed protein product [Trichobilharzia regenti]|nr:unnamed protein product [Trichobilharzia regenti]